MFEANASCQLQHFTHVQAKCCWTSRIAPQALKFKISTFGLWSTELTNRGNLAKAKSKCRAVPIQRYERHGSSPLLQLSNFWKHIFHCRLQNHGSLPSTPAKIPACPTMQHIALCLETWKCQETKSGQTLRCRVWPFGFNQYVKNSLNASKIKNKPAKSPWNLSNAPACNSCTIQAPAFSGLIS